LYVSNSKCFIRQTSLCVQAKVTAGSHVISCTAVCSISADSLEVSLFGLQWRPAVCPHGTKQRVAWRRSPSTRRHGTGPVHCDAIFNVDKYVHLSCSSLDYLWKFYPMSSSSSREMALLDVLHDNRKYSSSELFAAHDR
jgi:hypothetical protein